MKAPLATVFAALLTLVAPLAHADDTRMVGVVFDRGADTMEIADEVHGDESVMYRLRAKEGQRLSVTFRPVDENTQFVLYGPGKWPGEELHDSAADGVYAYQGRVGRNGPHAVLVSRSMDTGRSESEPARYELVLVLEQDED